LSKPWIIEMFINAKGCLRLLQMEQLPMLELLMIEKALLRFAKKKIFGFIWMLPMVEVL